MQRDLVIQLHFFRAEALRQSEDALALRQILAQRLGHGLRQRDLVQQRAQILQRGVEGQAALLHLPATASIAAPSPAASRSSSLNR